MASGMSKNALYYTMGSIIKAVTSFVLLPIYTNVLGASQYGTLNLLQTFSIVMVAFMTLSTERSIYRLYHDCKTDDQQSNFLSSIFWFIVILGSSCAILSVSFSNLIVPLLDNVDIFSVFIPVVLYTFANAIYSFCMVIMQVRQDGRSYLISSMLFLVLYNVFALCFIFCFEKKYSSVIYGELLAFFICAVFTFCLIKKNIKFFISLDIIKKVLAFCLPILGTVVFSWILNMTDRFFISSYASMSDVGVYSLAAKITSVIVLFVSAIYQAYNPYFFQIVNSKEINEAKTLLIPINNTISLFIGLLSILVVIVSKPIICFFFSSEYEDCYLYIYFLVLSVVFMQQSGLLNPMIYQNKKSLSISLIVVSVGILSLVLNSIFIPKYGSIFASIVNLICGLIWFVLTYNCAKKEYFIGFYFPNLIYSIIIIICCFVIDLFIQDIFVCLIVKILLFLLTFMALSRINILSYPALSGMCKKLIQRFK